jgi:putative PIN family toxin of toxin-antitoxin system
MRRIVLDTSVVIAGLRTQLGAGNAVLRLVATRRLVALATPPLFLEYEDVLKRPEHRLAHGLAPEAIEEFLAELAALIEPVEVHFQWRPQSRDPNDEMVLEAAINGRADALVTYNVADFAGPAERFRISVLLVVQVVGDPRVASILLFRLLALTYRPAHNDGSRDLLLAAEPLQLFVLVAYFGGPRPRRSFIRFLRLVTSSVCRHPPV